MGSVLQTTLLALHLIIVIALVIFILLQPSEGGGLGMGGGGMDSFMSGHAKANFFTRTTAILATCFFLTTLIIGILTGQSGKSQILEESGATAPQEQSTTAPLIPNAEGSLDFNIPASSSTSGQAGE